MTPPSWSKFSPSEASCSNTVAFRDHLERRPNYNTFSSSTAAASDTNVCSYHQQDLADPPTTRTQAGVQQIEATALAWTRHHLALAYALVWLAHLVLSLQQAVAGSLAPWVVSSFGHHGLVPVVAVVVGSLVGGLWKLALAKVLDVFGRHGGYAVSVLALALGLAATALCWDVRTYAASQVLYWVGYHGVSYALAVLVADTSALRSRGLVMALGTSPYMITAWMGGPVAQAFLDGPGFRWGFAAFALATPVVCAPLFVLLLLMLRRARTLGLVPAKENKRECLHGLKYYAEEFDIFGLALLTSGSALLLLAISLFPLHQRGWRSPPIITMAITGPLLLAGFAAWERSRPDGKTFMPYRFLTNRTILGGCSLSAALFASFYIWNSYFLSYLQVVHDLNPAQASYVYSIYNVGSCLVSVAAGFFVMYKGRFKGLALYVGLPLNFLGLNLMIWSRNDQNPELWKTVAVQVVISIGGGVLLVAEQMSVQSAVDHEHVAVVLAVQGVFASLGGAVGGTVATTVWQSVFADRLVEYLPDDLTGAAGEIYGDLGRQKSYAVGTAARWAINRAYGDAQVVMLVVALAILAPAFGFVMMWRDINVMESKQVKGTVFGN